jgi:hypothetical protein
MTPLVPLNIAPTSTPGVAGSSGAPLPASPQARASTAATHTLAPPLASNNGACGSASAQQQTRAPRATLPPPPQLRGYGSGKIAGHSADLMGYELLKASIHEKPTGKSAELLERGQEAMNLTRADLPCGRGNIGSDQLATGNQSSVRVAAGLGILEHVMNEHVTNGDVFDEYADANPSIIQNIAEATIANIASITQAGNCDGFSAKVFAHLAEGGLHKDESIARQTDHNEDAGHVWAEFRFQAKPHQQEQKVVLDAWASGPATLAEDARFGTIKDKPGAIISSAICSPEDANDFTKLMSINKRVIKGILNTDEYINSEIANTPFEKKFSNYSQNPVPSLSKSFIDKTMLPRTSPVASQVQAVGVLRKSDDADARMSVQAAVAAAPKVIAAADKLRAEVIRHELEANPPSAR